MARKKAKGPAGQLKKLLRKPWFAPGYAIFAVIVLLATSLFWAITGAHLQLANSDQLINPQLFENGHTFHQAQFPGAHSQLVKWPLFWLVKLFGLSSGAYTFFTVAAALLTVAGLALVMYRITKRPLVFGTLCLALASALMLVPTMPYGGGLLPVNMAMLATRNLEYLLYMLSLWLLIKTSSLRSRSFWLGVSGMVLLTASDRLFLSLSLGGALLALVVYALAQSWKMVSLATNWLVGSLLGGAIGFVLLWLIQATGLTHFAGQSGTSPYAAAHGLHSVALGTLYAIGGLFTNLGANPAYDATVVRHIPHQLLARLFGVGGLAYLINIVVLLLGALIIWRLMAQSIKKTSGRSLDTAWCLAVTLVWSAIAATGIFIVSNHYYAVDARYLTIALFAAFVSAAVYSRRNNWAAERLVLAGTVLLVGVLFGVLTTARTYHSQHQVLTPTNNRNTTVSQILKQHPVPVLLGDYWRVLPIKVARESQAVTPLSNCTQARTVLSSSAWQTDINKHGFAYLLSLDRGLTDYPRCSLDQVINNYGRPNTSVLVAGSLKNPQELLLFYDHGIHRSSPKTPSPPQGPATVLPIPLDQLPYAGCNGPTIMNIVAHQDDDLLFMNPNLLSDIKAGHCVRTVYLTAGDGGGDRFYWLGREQGSEAAYASMTGDQSIWIQRIVELSNHEFITVANPKGNTKISLIFMHLPDGNLKGEGFSVSHNQSLAKLDAGKINQLEAVDGQSSYSSVQLEAALVNLMHLYQPAEIRTQANVGGTKYTDHSDHMAVGRFVKKAYVTYEQQQYAGLVTIPLQFYIGYPVHERPSNVSDGDLQAKEDAFLAYAKYDGGVCHSSQQCLQDQAYGAYLTRQYTSPD